MEYVCEARQSRAAVLSRAAVTSGPLQQGIDPGLIAQLSRRRERPGVPGRRQGTRADGDANWESSDPGGRGWRPSQRSQESPNSPQPVRLECRNQRASRWCRQSAALKPAGSASGCVACQRTIRNVCSVWSCSPRNTFMASSKTFLPPDGSHVRYSDVPGGLTPDRAREIPGTATP